MGDVFGAGGDRIYIEGIGWKKSPPAPDPASFNSECVLSAEEAAEQVLNCVHPTLDSHETRTDVIDFLQRLIEKRLNLQVFPYGSVPLKTYLPDGDIDVTVLKAPNTTGESLPRDVLAVLQGETLNEYAEYPIKAINFIDAEVKLVKCVVRDIVIDISFNQLGGLSTLCFLEQVDRIVGRNHLFKRSIILVKSWCYYESRILGAHHGLISTYAMETLVLYIFHMFHESLSGPISVLYKFLQYYSQFDWENYCVSLKGPVRKSSLPDIVVEVPENGANGLMLSEEFLEKCMEMFSVPLMGLDDNPKPLQTKFLNIIDPLKENNNLGRSVNMGNFFRIRSAFKYGARKLGHILLQPRDKVANEVREFFANTLARHGHLSRSSTQLLSSELGDEESFSASLSSPLELSSEEEMLLKLSFSDIDNDTSRADYKSTPVSQNELDRIGEIGSEMASETRYWDVAVSGDRRWSEAYDLAATPNSSLRYGFKSYSLTRNDYPSFSRNHCQEPFRSSAGNIVTGNFEQSNLTYPTSQKGSSGPWLENGDKRSDMNNTYHWSTKNSKAVCITGPASSTPKSNIWESPSFDFREMDLASIEDSEPFNSLADLSGDYDSHIRSLLYGQLCNGVADGIECKRPWDVVRQSMPLRQSQFAQTNSYPFSMEQSFYTATDFDLPPVAYHSEQNPTAQGNSTYFPFNGYSLEDGRMVTSGNHNLFHNYAPGNGIYLSSEEDPSYFGKAAHEVQHPHGRLSQGRGTSDRWGQSHLSAGDKKQTDDSESCRIEFGSVGNLAQEVISGPRNDKGSTPCTSVETWGKQAVLKQERVPVTEFMQLKNEDEFPPLCPLNA